MELQELIDTIQNKFIKTENMKEIVDKLVEKSGITEEQAHKALETIKDYVKEKFPMMAGAVDKLFDSEGEDSLD